MDKYMLVKDIKSSVKNGGFINISQLAKYLRKSRGSAAEIVNGLDYLEMGREKKFFIEDVAARIAGMKKLG